MSAPSMSVLTPAILLRCRKTRTPRKCLQPPPKYSKAHRNSRSPPRKYPTTRAWKSCVAEKERDDSRVSKSQTGIRSIIQDHFSHWSQRLQYRPNDAFALLTLHRDSQKFEPPKDGETATSSQLARCCSGLW